MPLFSTNRNFLAEAYVKGGKEKELPVDHKLEELLDQYLKATGLEKEPGSFLIPAACDNTGKLSPRPLVRTDARGHAQAAALASWFAGSLIASLLPRAANRSLAIGESIIAYQRMVGLGKGAAVSIERVARCALAEGRHVCSLAWFYLHPSNQLLPMIGVHPVGRSVIVDLDVSRGPIQLCLKFVLTWRQTPEYKSALPIGFDRDGLATGREQRR